MSTVIKTIAAILFLGGAFFDYFLVASPFATGATGFFPSMIFYLFGWFFSVSLALLYLEALLTLPQGSNLLSMTESYFGITAKRILAVVYSLFFSYPLLANFFSFLLLVFKDELGPLIGLSFSQTFTPIIIYLFFFLFFALVLWFGLRVTLIFNFLLSVGIFITYFLILKKGAPYVNPENLLQTSWSYLLAAFPIFYFFRYQAVLPVIISFLQRRYKLLILVIILGILLPQLSLLGFNWLVVGSTRFDDLFAVFNNRFPLLAGLELIDKAPWFGQSVIFFSLFAVVNCCMINAYATLEIFADGLKIRLEKQRGRKRLILTLLVLIPPVLFSFFFYNLSSILIVIGLDLSDLLLAFLVISTVWIIRYRDKLAMPRLLFGGKTMLVFLYCYLFYYIWLHVIGLLR